LEIFKDLQHGRKLVKLEFDKGRKALKVKRMWIRKDQINVHVVHISLKTTIEDVWYLDNGCSKHMADKKEFLVNYEHKKGGSNMFGDGLGNKVVGNDMLNIEDMPKLRTLHVNGLKVNLISIS
jgi:hypothetical protein